jgi:formylglycine-generating enzyme required for sulfatase activity
MRRRQSALGRSVLVWALTVILLAACEGVSTGETPFPEVTPTMAATPSAGQTRLDGRGIEQVWVPAGSFLMGTDEAAIHELEGLAPPSMVLAEFPLEQPQHEVRITRGFWIDKYEVTTAAFQAFVDDGGYRDQAYWSEAGWEWLSGKNPNSLPRYCSLAQPDTPRACITWYEAEAYANWRDGRLPTEAEWEYAARGPQSLVYPWGNEFDASRCNVVDSKGPTAVGSFPQGASWVGALDMAGNAAEWVQDWLGDYAEGLAVDPAGPASGTIKIQKGGWWGGDLFVARAAYRQALAAGAHSMIRPDLMLLLDFHLRLDPPDYGDYRIGFRIVSP